ncbi:MAG: hypothetical protein M3M99_06000 [Actinomycetota bacterium]|nr:hypothetical protein [Actinomycetota bacterium]
MSRAATGAVLVGFLISIEKSLTVNNENHYQKLSIDRGTAAQYFSAMDFILLAHAGHWAMWVLYLVPVVIVLVATGRAFLEERRERREGS